MTNVNPKFIAAQKWFESYFGPDVTAEEKVIQFIFHILLYSASCIKMKGLIRSNLVAFYQVYTTKPAKPINST
jgi:hypothetical protein